MKFDHRSGATGATSGQSGTQLYESRPCAVVRVHCDRFLTGFQPPASSRRLPAGSADARRGAMSDPHAGERAASKGSAACRPQARSPAASAAVAAREAAMDSAGHSNEPQPLSAGITSTFFSSNVAFSEPPTFLLRRIWCLDLGSQTPDSNPR